MATIKLSMDGDTLTCPDVQAGSGEPLIWSLDPALGSIVSFSAVTGNVLSGPPEPNSKGQFAATIAAGKAGQNQTYTIEVQPSAVGSGRIKPPKPPKITVMAT